MPRTNQPVTLHDLLLTGGSGSSHAENAAASGSGGMSSMPSRSSSRGFAGTATGSNNIRNSGDHGNGSLLNNQDCHPIPTLPNAPQARALLERVVREFAPIAQQRGYHVVSVSELCCCHDGLDFDDASSGKGLRKKKKLAKMNDNVLGYNQTTTMSRGAGGGRNTKSHTVHLRLRPAHNHNILFDYEDVAGTMAHELAHCERAPHDDIFFQVMDQILEEHAVRMASNITTNGGLLVSMPSFSGHGQILGGGGGGMGRSRLLQPGAFAAGSSGSGNTAGRGGRTLGGDAAFTQWMTPTQAAAVAALARRRQEKFRRRGDGCCNSSSRGIFDIVSDNTAIAGDGTTTDADDDDPRQPKVAPTSNQRPPVGGDGRKRRPPAVAAAVAAASCLRSTRSSGDENQSPNTRNKKRQQKTRNNDASTFLKKNHDIIDLTFSDDDDSDEDGDHKKVPQQQERHDCKGWFCMQCTFLNPHAISTCNMCATPRA
jgi:WLM domain